MFTIAKRLKTLRDRDKISQNALAKELDITRATVNAWEMGISYPNAQSLIMLSRYFNVSVDYLLGTDERVMLDIGRLNSHEQDMVSEMVKYLVSIKKKQLT